jgi:hypothetical protein
MLSADHNYLLQNNNYFKKLVYNPDIVDWLSGCKYGLMPYFQNNWTLQVSIERTIRTQINTD